MPLDPSSWDPLALELSRRLDTHVRAEIAAAGGALPFDRFMDLALYAPGLGYYVAGAPKLGSGGDFVTAPEVSPLFGACLAAQCAEVLARLVGGLGGGDILELGPGSGALASQVLGALAGLGALPGRYLLLEPSPDLAERQRARLHAEHPDLAGRCEWLSELPSGFRGIVLANEVLDAMPVHRFRIGDDARPLECFVTAEGGDLGETWGPVRSPGLSEAVAALQASGLATAPGYTSEVNLRAGPWLAAIADALEAGLVLLIDYGYPERAYYQPDRSMGTLMCHLRHRAHSDPYTHLGLQDITAHVDFSAAARAGSRRRSRHRGLHHPGPFPDRLRDRPTDSGQSVAGPPDLDLLQGAKQLLLPTAMGERFKVLGLSRDLEGPWRGFCVRDLADRL